MTEDVFCKEEAVLPCFGDGCFDDGSATGDSVATSFGDTVLGSETDSVGTTFSDPVLGCEFAFVAEVATPLLTLVPGTTFEVAAPSPTSVPGTTFGNPVLGCEFASVAEVATPLPTLVPGTTFKVATPSSISVPGTTSVTQFWAVSFHLMLKLQHLCQCRSLTQVPNHWEH